MTTKKGPSDQTRALKHIKKGPFRPGLGDKDDVDMQDAAESAGAPVMAQSPGDLEHFKKIVRRLRMRWHHLPCIITYTSNSVHSFVGQQYSPHHRSTIFTSRQLNL